MIDAARDLFIAQGYRGVTLDAIIARAGGSRETIYRVFGGKAGLLRAIIAQTGSEMAQGVVEPIAPDLTPRVVLMRIGTELAKVWRSSEGRAINRMVISEGFDNPELVEAWYLGGPAPTLAVLEDYLNAQVTAGRLRRMEARLVARQFVSLVMCELAFPLVSGSADPRDPPARVENCVGLILAAYEAA
jgi:TetR/AcrR family transcriptional repressor of mexJK operon